MVIIISFMKAVVVDDDDDDDDDDATIGSTIYDLVWALPCEPPCIQADASNTANLNLCRCCC